MKSLLCVNTHSVLLLSKRGSRIQFGDAMVAMTKKVCARFDFVVHVMC